MTSSETRGMRGLKGPRREMDAPAEVSDVVAALVAMASMTLSGANALARVISDEETLEGVDPRAVLATMGIIMAQWSETLEKVALGLTGHDSRGDLVSDLGARTVERAGGDPEEFRRTLAEAQDLARRLRELSEVEPQGSA